MSLATTPDVEAHADRIGLVIALAPRHQVRQSIDHVFVVALVTGRHCSICTSRRSPVRRQSHDLLESRFVLESDLDSLVVKLHEHPFDAPFGAANDVQEGGRA